MVKEHLKKKGWLIIPTADIVRPDGKGPRAESTNETLILPDFDVVHAREGRQWAEVKAKAGAIYTVLTNTMDHGIGRYYWRHYCRVAEATRCPVWLFIIEFNTGDLLYQDCAVLAERIGHVYEGEKQDPGGMIYFPRTAFLIADDYPEPPPPNPAPEARPKVQGNLFAHRGAKK
jgi:hypothetical protein